MTRFAIVLAAGVSVVALSSAACAADLIIEEPVEVGVVAASGDWDGVFVGAFAGWAAGELSDDFGGEETSGWLLGVNAGVNFTLTDGIVAGVVGDIAWTDLINVDFDDVELLWTGSLRGRLGYDGGSFMPYLTAGLAFGQGHAIPPDTTNFHFGWTAGVGVELAVADDVSIDLLYKYTDLAPENYSGPDIGFETHSVTVGLNWSF
jgi:outer membrane immunogenic protein